MINNTEDITIKDFTSFYIKHKSKILKVFILGLFGVILFTFLSPPNLFLQPLSFQSPLIVWVVWIITRK